MGAGIGEIAAVEAGSAQQVAHQLVAAGIAPQDPRAHRFTLLIAEPDPLPLPGEADGPQPPRLQRRVAGNLAQNSQHRMPQLGHILFRVAIGRQTG